MRSCFLLTATFAAVVFMSTCVHGRKWTDSTGQFSVDADFVSLKNGKVTLKKPDGKIIEVPLERLSNDDKRHVSSRESQSRANPHQAVVSSPAPPQQQPSDANADLAATARSKPDAHPIASVGANVKPEVPKPQLQVDTPASPTTTPKPDREQIGDQATVTDGRSVSLREITAIRGEIGQVFRLAFSSDGQMLASSSVGGLKLWDTARGVEIATLDARAARSDSLAFSPDSKELFTTSKDLTLDVWDIDSKTKRQAGIGQSRKANAFISPDGRVSVEISSDSKDATVSAVGRPNDTAVLAWDVMTGLPLFEPTIPKNPLNENGDKCMIRDVAFTPDGKTMAVAGNRFVFSLFGSKPVVVMGAINLYDLENRKHIETVNSSRFPAECIAVSPDGGFLAIGGGDLDDIRLKGELVLFGVVGGNSGSRKVN